MTKIIFNGHYIEPCRFIGLAIFRHRARLAEERARQQALKNATPTTDNATVRADGLAANMAPQAEGKLPNRKWWICNEGFAEAPRLAIETPQLTGSIALMGARFDDLVLTAYGADAGMPRAKFCCNAKAKKAIGKRSGFVAAAGSKVTLPDEKTVWQASGEGL